MAALATDWVALDTLRFELRVGQVAELEPQLLRFIRQAVGLVQQHLQLPLLDREVVWPVEVGQTDSPVILRVLYPFEVRGTIGQSDLNGSHHLTIQQRELQMLLD